MKSKKTPVLKQAGTPTASAALKLIGDDPATLVLAIQLMDRMFAQRAKRRIG